MSELVASVFDRKKRFPVTRPVAETDTDIYCTREGETREGKS